MAMKLGNIKNTALVGAISATLMASVALWEGDKKDPYWDIVNVLTVCSGHTGKDITIGKRYSQAECDAITKRDIYKHQVYVLQCVTRPLKQNEFDAFTLFTFNLGGSAFCNSTFLKKYNAGDVQGACDGMLAWNKAGGKVVKGLQNRRQFERKLCLGESVQGVPMYDEGGSSGQPN